MKSPKGFRLRAHPPERKIWQHKFLICLAAALVIAGCASRKLIDTPNLYSKSNIDPFKDTPAEFQSNIAPILYATDRTIDEDGEYGYGRSKSLAFGVCEVEMGKNVSWADLVRNSRKAKRDNPLPLSVRRVRELGRFPDTPIPMIRAAHGLVDEPDEIRRQQQVETILLKQLRAMLQKTGRKEVFLFIHGYNNTFSDSVYVISELWHFMGRQGVPVAYSWPAGLGGLRGYTHDTESAEFTIFHLKQFIKLMASLPELEKINIIAHSRGTVVLSSMVRELVIEGRAAGKNLHKSLKFGELVFAAPDLDLEVTSQRIGAERLGFAMDSFTMYVSQEDKALGLSDWLYSSVQRLGKVTLESLSSRLKTQITQRHGIDIIENEIDVGFIGHSYFYSDPSISSDLILLLGQKRKAGAAHGRPLRPLMKNYWSIWEGYPFAE